MLVSCLRPLLRVHFRRLEAGTHVWIAKLPIFSMRDSRPCRCLELSLTPLIASLSFLASFYDKIHSVTGLAVAELKHLEHHMLQA